MGRYRCDGLVIATPIGSTAYAYSAGGPVVSPALDAVVVAPLAPMAGISRPMVIAADEPIRLTLLEGSGCPALELDGTMLRRTAAGRGARRAPAAALRASSSGSTATATSAATRSSSACSTCRSCRRSCATCSPAAIPSR